MDLKENKARTEPKWSPGVALASVKFAWTPKPVLPQNGRGGMEKRCGPPKYS